MARRSKARGTDHEMSETSAPSGAPNTAHANRRELWLAVALALLSCLPVALARYPQMSDYPAHLARYAVMLDAGRSADLARWYSFRWQWSGNVGVDLLIRPFAALFGLEQGGRVIAGLIPPLTGLALIALARVLRGRIGLGGFLSFAFIWSPMMLVGLLNFALGQALALLVFAAWVWADRLEGEAAEAVRIWRVLLAPPAALVVWLCHVSAWGMLGLLVFGYELERARQRGWAQAWRAFVNPWPLALPGLALVFGGGVGGWIGYGDYVWIYKRAIWLKAMRDTAYPLDFLSLVLVASVLLLALIRGRLDMRLGWGALMLMLGGVLMPRHISGGDYADYRMVTGGLMTGCLAIDFRRSGFRQGGGREWRWTAWAAAALFLARLAVTSLNWQADSERTGQILAALDQVPRGGRVASAVLVHPDSWPLNHYEHIGDYALIRRHALVNANFALPGVHMLHMAPGLEGFVDTSQRLYQMTGTPVDLAHFWPARQADWLWYVGDREPDSLPAGAVVVWRAPRAASEGQPIALLARLAKAPVQR